MNSDIDAPINIGNPQERTILEFAQAVLSLMPDKGSIKYMPALPDDPKKRRPDISKAKKLLGWEPHVELSIGLSSTIDYFKNRVKID